MRILTVDHPLVAHKLTLIRDRRTDSPTFRRLVDEVVTLLAYEATRTVGTEPVEVATPLRPAEGSRLAGPAPLVVPVLRAGLGMLEGMTRLLPMAEVGFIGMVRNEDTLQAASYGTRLPADLAARHVFLLDPMLATGGTMSAAVRLLRDRGAASVTCLALLAAPEGLARLERDHAGVPLTVVTAAIDDGLDHRGYIVPGLGDAGDRLYGAVG